MRITASLTIPNIIATDHLDNTGASVAMSATRKAALDTGIVISNGTDADHDIDFAVGSEVLYNGSTYKYFTGTALTKQIDANWVAGDAAGGFPSGLSLAATTGYYLYMIGKTDGTVDYGFDTSLTAANLLSDATGYTYYKAIWWVITDASSNVVAFTQVNGDTCEYAAAITDVQDTSGTSGTNETATISAPPNCTGIVYGAVNNHTSTSSMQLRLNNKIGSLALRFIGCMLTPRLDGSSQLLYCAIFGTGSLNYITLETHGWRKKW